MDHGTLLLDSRLGHMRLERAPGGAAIVGHVCVCDSKCVFRHNPRRFGTVPSHFHRFFVRVVPPAMDHGTLLLVSRLGYMRLERAPGGAAIVGHVGVCNSKCVFRHNPRPFGTVPSQFSLIFCQGRSPSDGPPHPATG